MGATVFTKLLNDCYFASTSLLFQGLAASDEVRKWNAFDTRAGLMCSVLISFMTMVYNNFTKFCMIFQTSHTLS